MRGLKHISALKQYVLCVAPYVGAWIETALAGVDDATKIVAPYVGAWIETSPPCLRPAFEKSHPTWVRGLKLAGCKVQTGRWRRTLRGCVD